MDTLVRIAVYDASVTTDSVRVIIDQAFEKMAALEGRLSASVDTSELKSLSQYPQTVSGELDSLLTLSRHIADLSDGALDITIGPLNSVWNFYDENPTVPADAVIQKALQHVDYQQVYQKDRNVWLANSEVVLDLGAIAKGFIVDQVVQTLKTAGVRSALIEAGGDLRIFGKHPKNRHWRIGVRHPRPEAGSMYAVCALDSGAIATSGDYERFFEQEGKRYHHLLNPKNGYPARGCVSVTIRASSAAEADGYATAVFVSGPEKGLALLQSQSDVEGLIIYEEQGKLKHVVTEKLENYLTFF